MPSCMCRTIGKPTTTSLNTFLVVNNLEQNAIKNWFFLVIWNKKFIGKVYGTSSWAKAPQALLLVVVEANKAL